MPFEQNCDNFTKPVYQNLITINYCYIEKYYSFAGGLEKPTNVLQVGIQKFYKIG